MMGSMAGCGRARGSGRWQQWRQQCWPQYRQCSQRRRQQHSGSGKNAAGRECWSSSTSGSGKNAAGRECYSHGGISSSAPTC